MQLNDAMAIARDAMSAKRVFGDPHQVDGVTLIPAAAVGGGMGGGVGSDRQGEATEGAGFGIRASPIGAYSVDHGVVRWHPAIDVNRLIGALAAVAMTYLVTRWLTAKAHARARQRPV